MSSFVPFAGICNPPPFPPFPLVDGQPDPYMTVPGANKRPKQVRSNQLMQVKGNIMKNIKLISAAALLVAASSGAFATETDGVADNAWLKQTAISQQAPAPAAAAAADTSRITEQSNQAVTP